MRTDRQSLEDIREHIRKIEERAPASREALEHDELLQVWVLYHLTVVGEAARNVSEHFRDSHPEVRWSRMVGLRNKVTHGYFDIDLDVIWNVVEYDVPELRSQIATALAKSP